MALFLLAYLAGVLTIVSPCILPVLPFVFARTDRPFLRSTLPMLLGMAATFAGVATLAAVGGGWAVQANQIGRMVMLAVLALFGVTLLFPTLSERMTRPLVALGANLSQSIDRGVEAKGSSIASSLLLGLATGLLWAPCAGPVLGLILTGAALNGASARTSLLLLTYAAGAATSLALALLIGGKVFAAMKRSLGAGEWIRRGLGVAVLGAVFAIAFGLDTGLLTRLSFTGTTSLEQGLLDRLRLGDSLAVTSPGAVKLKPAAGETLPVEGEMPSLSGAVEWLNSPPLTTESLRGKVVLVDFWTYSCINCLRSIPYVRAWAEKYRNKGLVVIGVHAPEFAFEKNISNVKKAVADFKVDYPVAIDNDWTIWRAFKNSYWPAHYFIDANGKIRHHQFGEGKYDESELVIQQLLAEAKMPVGQIGLVKVDASGAEAASDQSAVKSPETYIGYVRLKGLVSPGGVVRDAAHTYLPGTPALNEWGLGGRWIVGRENATLESKVGSIVYRFHSRDLHLVLAPAQDGKPIRFRVTLDGAAPGANHGTDTNAEGEGTVTEDRLYQLIRQAGPVSDHLFEIHFLDPGVKAFAFTFG